MKKLFCAVCALLLLLLAGCGGGGSLPLRPAAGRAPCAESTALPSADGAGGESETLCEIIELSEGVLLDVPLLPQEPELQNGCEVTSLTMLLNYRGCAVDKTEMASAWLPCTDDFYGTDPEVQYMGYPDAQGWYCYQGPIIAAANGYLAWAESPLRAADKTGADIEALKALLAEGTPVACWVTVDLQPPRASTRYSWPLGGGQFVPLVNVHCLVLTGYDETQGLFHVADPMCQYQSIEQDVFMQVFEAMGSRAVVIV